ncbi:MAG: transcriptional regulator [Leptolyngbyaceae cyanobacterium bins.59]|nr:transcriptional regulator [Leptolyngbyaceae cyanobacterium bins.59]
MNMPTSRDYHSYLIESLKDPQEAAAYLEAVLEDGTSDELHLALKNVAEAQIATMNDHQITNHQEIIRHISEQSELNISSLLKTLDEMGFKLTITPKQPVL